MSERDGKEKKKKNSFNFIKEMARNYFQDLSLPGYRVESRKNERRKVRRKNKEEE